MTRGRILLAIVIALVVCLGLGYAWGASGRAVVQTALEDSRQQLDLAEARGALLDARVSLYNNNFGDASRRFEESKDPLRRSRMSERPLRLTARCWRTNAIIAAP